MINLYNTMSRKTELLESVDKSVKLYSCGLTVYSNPHIGNWVAYIYWDVLYRLLVSNGFNVTRVQNITDVGHLTSDEDAGEDKMLKGALKEGMTAWEVADKYIDIANHEAYEVLNLLKPEYMPRATEYINQQIDFVKSLEDKGFTYSINDGVYFDTSKLLDYGKLAKLDIEGLQFGKRVEATGKKNPTDFAIWKFSGPNEKRDMEWDSPWGKGFPGWHLECSTMAREILGDQIDIHTGGIDHIPVHHTNEIAQTEALTGKEFSRFWVHANHIKVNGTKMSKSLGNIYTLDDISKKGFDVMAFKLLVLSKHYRTEGNFTWSILESSQNRQKKWKATADRRWQLEQDNDANSDEILMALNDDINTPKALSMIDQYFDIIELKNLAPNTHYLEIINKLLGIDLFNNDISADIKALIKKREVARENKDWNESDRIRDLLKEKDIELNDMPDQTTLWNRI